jgi:hypothetical protein
VFGGFAGGSWAGTGADSSADDSFIMELSPYPRRWESSGTSNFIVKAVNGWPEWGNDELRFGINGQLGLGDTTNPNAYDARCIAGTVYGTQLNQPCGANANAWGATQMEVYYQCGEGSGNGPCPWEQPTDTVPVVVLHQSNSSTVPSGYAGRSERNAWEQVLGSWGLTGDWTVCVFVSTLTIVRPRWPLFLRLIAKHFVCVACPQVLQLSRPPHRCRRRTWWLPRSMRHLR